VVKALHLFAAAGWPVAPGAAAPAVVLCGDAPAALAVSAALVSDLGARPVMFGGLDRARQVEEVAGFVMRLVGLGVDPVTAIPAVPPR